MPRPEKTRTIALETSISTNDGKQTWQAVELKEPTLLQVKQFYDEQKKSETLNAMGLVISLISGIPREVVNKLGFTDYKECEEYLLSFLTYSPMTGETI